MLTNELAEPSNATVDRRQRDREENSMLVPSKRPRRAAIKSRVIAPPVSHLDARMDKGKERAPSPGAVAEDSEHECVTSSDALPS